MVSTVTALGFVLAACAGKGGGTTAQPGGESTIVALPSQSAFPTSSGPVTSNLIAVALGETDATHMFINLSATQAAAGKVTFVVANQGQKTHEFVVLQTDTPAANFPIGSFEGESNRIDEDAAGTNVGETGDMKPGETKSLVIQDMQPGHYAIVCNLPGHYAMGMRQDFTVVGSASGQPSNEVTVSLGETDPSTMFIKLSADSATAGKVTFHVSNDGARTHEFVVLKTDTQAGTFPIGSFEGESNRIDEDDAGKNVGETGDMEAGSTKDLAITLKPGHYAVVCNLPGHYRMGMHQDFWVIPEGATAVAVGLGETDPMHMFIDLSTTSAPAGTAAFLVTNQGKHTHEFVVLQTDTPAANFPIGSFEGESNRIDEDAAGTNVGETGDMEVGTAMVLVIKDMAAGHYAVVCNLPGHYRMGMHQDFTVS
jgi:uncharacterized cupredoxin-like copper-binding protein